jgi:hypothetical protein
VDRNVLQTFLVKPAKVVAAVPENAFTGLSSLLSESVHVAVNGPASLCLDFGLEVAGWVEFQSPDLAKAGSAELRDITLSISEFTSPFSGKTAVPTAFSGGLFRAEFPRQPAGVLYEGVRFIWITHSGTGRFTITNVSTVAQARPVEWRGSFHSANPVLDQIWYAGAYGTKVNMHASTLGSILVNRGDRKAFQGDNAVASAVAMAVFGNQSFGLVLSNLNSTDSGTAKGHAVHDDQLAPYPIYWTMTVCDYVWSSNDTAAFAYFRDDVEQILHSHVANANINWLNVKLNFFGWDDRIRIGSGESGFGVEGPNAGLEPQLGYVCMLIQSCRYFARTLKATGGSAALIANMTTTAEQLADRLRATPSAGGKAYWQQFGVHAAANLLLAEVPTPSQLPLIAANVFVDATAVCSWSPFNTFYTLQGMALAPSGLGYASAASQLCWENMIVDGRGCFWELNSPMWGEFMRSGDRPPPSTNSMCHPWSSGVTAFMLQHLLGVTALQPGHAEFVAVPYVSENLHSVQGVVPTATGAEIDVAAQWTPTRVTIIVNAPSPLHIGVLRANTLLRFSETAATLSTLLGVTVDGVDTPLRLSDTEIEAQKESLGRGSLTYSQRAERWFTNLLPAGEHTIIAYYDGAASTTGSSDPISDPTSSAWRTVSLNQSTEGQQLYPPFLPASYPVSRRNDTGTRGTGWLQRYGKSGYMLFGFDGGKATRSRSKIPTFLHNLSFPFGAGYGCVRKLCACAAADLTCLQDPAAPTKRRLGFVSLGGDQGRAVDVNTTLGVKYSLAIYCVLESLPPSAHFPQNPASMALRVMDLSPGAGHLNPVALTPHVHSSELGVWWVLECDRPIRVRVQSIYGEGRISALAFDTPTSIKTDDDDTILSTTGTSCTKVATCASFSCPSDRGNLSAGVLIPLGPQSQRPGQGLKELQARVVQASQLFLSLGASVPILQS